MNGDFAPRHFMKTSDPIMPMNVNVVEDIEHDVWQRNEDGLWYHPGLPELSWKHLLSRYGPLTEVRDDVTQPQEPKSDEAIKLAWFEIRLAAEQTADAFKRFNRAFTESIKKEKDNLRKREDEAKQRAVELEAEYQVWKARRTS
jgi:hypothetical protein